MGNTLTAEENAFKAADWSRLLELALNSEMTAALQAPAGTTSPRPAPATAQSATNTFRLCRKEWESLLCICDEINAAAVASSSAMLHQMLTTPPSTASGPDDELQIAQMRCPLVAVAIHFLAAVEGQLTWEKASQRWTLAARQLERNGSVKSTVDNRRPLLLVTKAAIATKELVHCASLVDFIADIVPRVRAAGEDIADAVACGDVSARPVIAFLLNLTLALLQEAYVATMVRLEAATTSDDTDELFNGLHGVRVFASAAAGVFNANVNKDQLRIACLRRLHNRLAVLTMAGDVAVLQLRSPLETPFERTPLDPWAKFSSSYVGQRHVVDEVQGFFESRALGLSDANKPAVLLMFGPSGHGKSELAKSLAKVLHGAEGDPESTGKLVVIHLPSMCTKESIYSLVDPPAAHVGEGLLLSAVRKNPDAVVVLDEFEKGAADAVQNLWLSAFQRDGMLRSLKDSSRSCSTSRTVFVLTCNIMASTIDADRDKYLNSTAARQEQMRRTYVQQCRQLVGERFGDPFLNRVDLFLPFVPYTFEERCKFARMQTDRLCAVQRAQGRDVLVGESLIRLTAASLRNFHGASRCTELMSADIAALAREWQSRQKAIGEGERPWILFSMVDDLRPDEVSQGGRVTSLSSLQDTSCLSRDESDLRSRIAAKLKPKTAPTAIAAPVVAAAPLIPDPVVPVAAAAAAAPGGSHTVARPAQTPGDDREMEMTVELQTEKDVETVLEKDLRQQLATVTDKLVAAEKELAYLRAYTKDLEKALGYALLTIAGLMCVMLLFVELTTLMYIAAAIALLVAMLPKLVMMALRALYAVLGPRGVAAVGAVLVAVLARRITAGPPSGCP